LPKISEISKTPPFIEWFELYGVNGYKTLRLDNRSCIKIVAAENGTGKTTLLSALHAVLTLDISKLATIDFIYLRLKLKDSKELIFNRKDILPKNYSAKPSEAILALKKYGVSDRKLRRNIAFIQTNGIESFAYSNEFRNIYFNCPLNREDLSNLYLEAIDQYYPNNVCRVLVQKITKALGELQILYLPTFRRIETEMSEFAQNKKSRRTEFGYETDDEDDNDQLIWFGMADVESRLEAFKERIKSVTLNSYSRISAQSLETLLSPASRSPEYIFDITDEFSSKLNLVLARLGHAGRETEAKIYDLIYSGLINETAYDGLRAHIHQIISIYATTQAQEQLIEGFTNVINSYWYASAIDTNGVPEKQFVFDKFALEVSVKNNFNDNTLLLNNLSSGEKQIVAIFAKLYLQQNKKYLILIDEPELSLAMSWQRRFLIDILESPSCHQLIAITHSPFIFDNDLDGYAESLTVKYEQPQQ
jgi:predicted ATPase